MTTAILASETSAGAIRRDPSRSVYLRLGLLGAVKNGANIGG
jgi:hypothetical protein